jgi:signal transduction histidine kinase
MDSRRKQAQMREAFTTLVGGITHRFNNDLHIITGNIDLLEMNLPDSEKINKYIGSMRASILRMSNLINQLLAFVGKGKNQPKPLSLTEFVAEFLPSIQYSINRGIRIETDLAPDVSYVKADFSQMRMVLSALLNNAQEAIEGEGVIQIATRNEEIGEDFANNQADLEPGSYACLIIPNYALTM